jgi:formylglycine-generating enzyme required for sulfatase activity
MRDQHSARHIFSRFGAGIRLCAVLPAALICCFSATFAASQPRSDAPSSSGITCEMQAPTRAERAAQPLSVAEECGLKPKDAFKECDTCPEMVVVPAGSFEMGAPDSEKAHFIDPQTRRPTSRPEPTGEELPIHDVRFASPFAVGRFAVTFDEWDACVADGGCGAYRPSDMDRGRGKRPVINVAWDDAQAYVAWLSRKTGRLYRLLSEAEREYVTRAATTTPFWWGNSISKQQAKYGGGYLRARPQDKAEPVDSFDPNPWGLYQVHGNVGEWVEDCWNPNYAGAPVDGSARTSGHCSERVWRGGSWADQPQYLRSASRAHSYVSVRGEVVGFRIARSLGPSASPPTLNETATAVPIPGGACPSRNHSERAPIFLQAGRPLSRAEECALAPKDSLKECETCPEMVVVPAGSFLMGAPRRDEGWASFHDPVGIQLYENPAQDWPQHEVGFKRMFAVGRFAVTFDEWDACVADGGCGGYRPSDMDWGRGRRPVINVAWDDAQAYVAWLSRKSGKPYRLLSEAEREYVTRAGTTTTFWWGNSISVEQANFTGGGTTSLIIPRLQPVDRFAPNPWGLYQVHGGVWEWVEDCWDEQYPHAPSDGSARRDGRCANRILRGGSWIDDAERLRASRRYVGFHGMRSDDVGFRVARTIDP